MPSLRSRLLPVLGVALVAGYLLAWPIANAPRAWQAPVAQGFAGPYTTNARLAGLQQAPLGAGALGPEHILSAAGQLYAGLSNGDLVRWAPDTPQQRERVASTGGRPLGLDMDAQGRLLVADAVRGLLRVTLGNASSAPRIEVLLDKVQHPGPDDPVAFANAVKVATSGVIWLTDSSRRFGAKAWGSPFAASVQDTMEHSCSGRLIALDPDTGVSRVALQGLCFANGLAFSADGRTLFLAETESYRILALDLAKLSLVRTQQGETGVPTVAQAMQQGAVRVLFDNLPGFPDNLVRAPTGRIWVGLAKPRSALLDLMAPHPLGREMVLRLPAFFLPVPQPYGHVFAFNDAGEVVDDLQDPQGACPETTGATEAGGRLFVHSVTATGICAMPYSGPTGH